MDQGVTWPPSPSPRMSSFQSWGMGSHANGALGWQTSVEMLPSSGELPSDLSEQPPSMWVASDRKGEEGAQ
jgi:hypothetical protein